MVGLECLLVLSLVVAGVQAATPATLEEKVVSS